MKTEVEPEAVEPKKVAPPWVFNPRYGGKCRGDLARVWFLNERAWIPVSDGWEWAFKVGWGVYNARGGQLAGGVFNTEKEAQQEVDNWLIINGWTLT